MDDFLFLVSVIYWPIQMRTSTELILESSALVLAGWNKGKDASREALNWKVAPSVWRVGIQAYIEA